ncbi:MAG: hypothetical protein PHW79_00060 [Candidatus Marinimicrobia bacterium]|nr:hypothetical protein [Candidatus Neomarinimicrobiota bacterium]
MTAGSINSFKKGLMVVILTGMALVSVGGAQENPQEILARVNALYSTIDDYAATVTLSVNITNFRMPKKVVKVFYKKPDKFSMKTDGFAMMPKVGVFPVPSNFIPADAQVRYNRSEALKGIRYHVLDVKPKESDKKDPEISLWINSKRWTIDRVILGMKDAGSSEVNLHYRQIEGKWLPDSTVVTLNYEKGIPKLDRPSIERPIDDPDVPRLNVESLSGTVRLIFSDVVINSGLDDSFFETEEK